MTTSVVITDTSVLINFLVLDQLHVLSQLTEFDFSVTEHVRAEITEHLQRPNAAFDAGSINEICETDIQQFRRIYRANVGGIVPIWLATPSGYRMLSPRVFLGHPSIRRMW